MPFLLGRNPKRLDIERGSNLAWIEYAVETPPALVDEAFALKKTAIPLR
jgi:hypothetical protein